VKLSATTCVNLMHRAEDHEFRLVIPFILCTGHSFLKFRAGFSNLLSRTYDSRHYAQGRHYAYDTGSCRFFFIWCLWRGAAHGTLRCRQLVCPTGLSASSFCSTWRARSCAFACTFGAVWKESVYSSILPSCSWPSPRPSPFVPQSSVCIMFSAALFQFCPLWRPSDILFFSCHSTREVWFSSSMASWHSIAEAWLSLARLHHCHHNWRLCAIGMVACHSTRPHQGDYYVIVYAWHSNGLLAWDQVCISVSRAALYGVAVAFVFIHAVPV